MQPMEVASERYIFKLQETLDRHPHDVTLVVEDGKEFKANRQVLSEASPFFEKLLNSDMRESKEGIVRLEMLTEAGLGDLLEFIYTGSVWVSDEDNARELTAMADFLFLPQLKSLAGRVLAQRLDTANCIATYYFAERYQCEELVTQSKEFILSNFTTVAKTNDFLNMAREKVEMWISSDEIDVSEEEDVFNIILTWIDHDRSERKKDFAKLFRQVRLVHVLRDNLISEFMTNELVKENECCLNLVKKALSLIDSKDFGNVSVRPRKSLEIPVIVACTEKYIICYFPREDTWCRLHETLPKFIHSLQFVSCHGKIYFIARTSIDQPSNLLTCDSFCNCWKSIPYTDNRDFVRIFSRNEDEVFALLTDNRISCPRCDWRLKNRREGDMVMAPPCGEEHIPYITKYKPESSSWEDIAPLPLERIHVEGICIVAHGNFIYFLGGGAKPGTNIALRDADRYNLRENKWDKIAELQEARKWACGTAAHGQIFIAGGVNLQSHFSTIMSKTCEVYEETTDEWQFIASLSIPRYGPTIMMCVDDKLYVLGGGLWSSEHRQAAGKPVECYDPVTNEWIEQTEMPVNLLSTLPRRSTLLNACSLRVFKRSKFLKNALCPDKDDKRKCLIM